MMLFSVVVQVLHESLNPSEQRSLMDVSDALAHLRLFGGAPSSGGGVGGREPSSASASAANNDGDGWNNTSAVVVVSRILDLVRGGGGGGPPGGGMQGGKLVRHCVSFLVMRSPSTTIGGGSDQRTDTRGGHYWILDGRLATATMMPRVMLLPPRGRGRGGRRRPIDRPAESTRPRTSKHHRTDSGDEIRRTMPVRAPVRGYTIRMTIRSSIIWTKRKV